MRIILCVLKRLSYAQALFGAAERKTDTPLGMGVCFVPVCIYGKHRSMLSYP